MSFPTHELLYKLSLRPDAKEIAKKMQKEISDYAMYVRNGAEMGRVYSKAIHNFIQLVENTWHDRWTCLIPPLREMQSDRDMLEDKMDKFVRLLAKDTELEEVWIRKLSDDLGKMIGAKKNHMTILGDIEDGTFLSGITTIEDNLKNIEKTLAEAKAKLEDVTRIEKQKKERTESLLKSAQELRAQIAAEEKYSDKAKKMKADLLTFLDGCIESKELFDLNEKWQARFHEDFQKHPRVNVFSDDLLLRIRALFQLSKATEVVDRDSKQLQETINQCLKDRDRLTIALIAAREQGALKITFKGIDVHKDKDEAKEDEPKKTRSSIAAAP